MEGVLQRKYPKQRSKSNASDGKKLPEFLQSDSLNNIGDRSGLVSA